MEEIYDKLRVRFPLLTNILFQDHAGNSKAHLLPLYLGIFLAVLENVSTSTPICFVLPRRGDIARISAILYAMNHLASKQKQLTKTYAEGTFNKGDLVCVYPGKHVFRYGGYDTACPDRVWLETLNDQGRWQVRAVDVVPRLERTTRTRPIGKLNSPILTPHATPLDSLLRTSYFGNLSLVKNELLILDTVFDFEDFVDSCGFLAGPQTTDKLTIRTLLPFGRITSPDHEHAGCLRKWDQNGSASGEPIIAVTHSAELLANYCIDAPARSKLVVVNGLDHIRNIQAYDDISQTQRLVIFADHDDEEMIGTLGKRGCKFWPLSKRELAVGIQVTSSTGIFGSVRRWAENYDALSIDVKLCEDARLDEIWFKLEKLHGATVRADNNILIRLVSRAWRLFLNACSTWDIPAADEREKILRDVGTYRLEVRQNEAWFAPDNAQTMIEIADSISDCYSEGSTLGVSKGAVLLGVVLQAMQENNKVAILVRNEVRVAELRRWLSGQNLLTNNKIFSPTTLPTNEAFDRVICVSWLRGDTMRRVVSYLVAPRVTVIGYLCEQRWLHQCQPRFKRHIHAATLTSDEKVALVCEEGQRSSKWPDDTRKPTDTVPVVGPDIWDFEYRLRVGRIGLAAKPTEATDTLPARYVRFSGDCYAFLTETHKLPVATELISSRAHPNQKLPERNLLDIKQGDFIVFPASGDRELIQVLADRLIGHAAMELRNIARLWKDALRSCGLSPEGFLREARALDRPLHPATIRNWFADTSQIGPGDKDDLDLIAIVTNDEILERKLDSVRTAIKKLRSAHLSAGMKLRDVLLQRLPQVIGQIEESGTKVDLGELGSAWIVRVESIETDTEPRGRTEVNRLLFDKFSQDISDLLRDLS